MKAVEATKPDSAALAKQDDPRKSFSEVSKGRPTLGLALSGGGIRSATFNLGILQGLSGHKLLRKVDVLSTVSGGGYIGAWLLGLIHERRLRQSGESPDQTIISIEEDLAPEQSGNPTSNGSRPIRFLRQYSNYLTPEAGFFTLDTWTMASIWLRNTFLNQMVLVPLVGVILLLPRLVGAFLPSFRAVNPWHAAVFAFPFLVALLSVVITLSVGLLGRILKNESLESLGRLGSIFNLGATGWLIVSAIAIYGPFAVYRLGLWVHTLTAGWIVSTAAGLLTGRSLSSGGGMGRKDRSALSYWVSALAPFVFVIGLCIFVSYWLDVLSEYLGLVSLAQGWPAVPAEFNPAIVLLPLGLLGISLLFAWRVDINDFSMHSLYKNRLVRCYLGAARSDKRRPNWVGMDPEDDFPLSGLDGCRPYPIINATLNLVHGDELAWQERKGECFTFSTDYCGFERPPLPAGKGVVGKYCPTREYGGGVSLGTAFVTSGAAVNPSWGYHSSAATTFLMALFNVRLGQWLGNPLLDKWKRRGPRTFLYWLCELLGYTNDKRGFVNLTDGGHFENLGIYELVRRKCSYIIVCDAGEDRSYAFEDLGGALRKCRTDFGVDIKVQTSVIRPDPETGHSHAHCVVGEIDYGDAKPGYILYIKASLTGDESDDVQQYHSSHPEFPHQSTADQWFDESQFESYRMLGVHVLDSVLESALQKARKSQNGSIDIESLFTELTATWYPQSEFIRRSFTKHAETFDLLMERIRKDSVHSLLPDFYPQIKDLYKMPLSSTDANSFVICNGMIQLMENVYLELHLEEKEQLDHPHNQGWVKLFRQWGKSQDFQNAWRAAAPTFGRQFRDFCHREIGLPKVDG